MSELAEDESWIFDSLVFFLNGPIWDAPVQSFIEEKSLIFEPNNENNPNYRKVYEEYKNLVDFMLGNFMEDIGISSQQFENACNHGSMEGISIQFQQNNFEQIWAANDYDMFVRMMTQRNVQLQLEALELIEQKYGITPDSFKTQKQVSFEQEKVTTQTKADINPFQSSKQFEKEVLEEISKQFSAEPQEESDQFLLEDKDILHKSLEDKIAFLGEQSNIAIRAFTAAEKKPEETIIKVTEEKIGDKPTKKESKSSVSDDTTHNYNKQVIEVSGVDLKKRQDYLRAQRDKLVALKKEARRKHLITEDDTNVAKPSQLRPKSSKAAQKILEGTENIEASQLEMRKVLAEKIKNEVIKNKSDV